jgi:predicted ATPase/DNA-binding XRE family transcriptional regulator
MLNSSADPPSFGALLRLHRRRLGFTQEALGEQAGFSVDTVKKLEGGSRRPSASAIDVLALALQLEAGELECFREAGIAARLSDNGSTRVRSNLPVQVTSFIGRQREIDEVGKLLRDPEIRLLTLTGPGGSGKTRLALQVSGDAVEDFGDGVFLVELAPVMEPTQVMTAVRTGLGIQEGTRSELETVRNWLGKKQLLLILDNFEHLLPAGPELVELLSSCARLKILTTSRVCLGVAGEHAHDVPPMDTVEIGADLTVVDAMRSDAVRLFASRAGAVKSDFEITDANVRSVAGICNRLDGLPLALELAAARVRIFRTKQLLELLEDESRGSLRMLTGGARGGTSRYPTLEAAIEWSYELLNDEAKTLLGRMSVFRGGCDLAAIEAVCGDDGFGVVPALEMLIQASLVREGEGIEGSSRYVMLETIREYALERLQEFGEAEELRRRHAEYFRVFAITAYDGLMSLGADRDPTMKLASLDRDNLRAALRWSIEKQEVDLGMAIVGWLMIWWGFTTPAEGLRWGQALRALPDPVRSPDRVMGLSGAAYCAWTTSQFDTTRSLSAEAVEIARGFGDGRPRQRAEEEALAWALIGYSVVAQDRSSVDAADEAIEIFRRIGPISGVNWGCHVQAITLPFHGEVEIVRQRLAESLEIGRRANDCWAQATGLMLQSFMAMAAGDVDAARELLVESVTLYRVSRDKTNLARALLASAGIDRLRGELDIAMSDLDEALQLSSDVGDWGSFVACLTCLAGVLLAQGHPERGAVLLGAADRIRDVTGAQPLQGSDALNAGIEEAVRDALETTAFDRAFAEGHAMSQEEAAAYALDASSS